MTSAYPLSDSSYPFTVFTPSSINASGAYTVSDKQINYTDKNRTTFQFQSNAFTYTVSNTTPNYKNGSFQVTVSGNNGNPFLVYAMDCILFAPYNSTSGWIDPYNNWQPNPASYTPYSQSGWTRTGTFVGPAITNSFSDLDVANEYVTPSVFYIQPSVPSILSDYSTYSVPIYSFIGSPYFSSVVTCPNTGTDNGGCANQSPTLPSRLNSATRDWILYYQMNPSSNICSTNIINGNMGFPFYYSSTTGSSFMYFEVIFALPMYGGQYLTNKTINAPGVSASAPTAPGYLLAFYKRAYPQCQQSPYEPSTTKPSTFLTYSNYTKSTDSPAYAFGNYFPVIYETGNFANQNTGKLPYNCSLLYLLNTIYDSSTVDKDVSGQKFSSVHDALVGLGWLENLGSGVDFGTVQVLNAASVNLGSEWYFAGYVPYNFGFQSTNEYWSGSVKNVVTVESRELAEGDTSGYTPFMGNNVVMATTVPTDSTGNLVSYYTGDKVGTPIGNYFWQSMSTNCVPLTKLYPTLCNCSQTRTFKFHIDVNGTGCGDYKISYDTYEPNITATTGGNSNIDVGIYAPNAIFPYNMFNKVQCNVYLNSYPQKTPLTCRLINFFNFSFESVRAEVFTYRNSSVLSYSTTLCTVKANGYAFFQYKDNSKGYEVTTCQS